MSLESSIAALTQQAGLLMDLPQQVNAAAQAQIASMGAAYQSHIAGLSVSAYVDQINGLDTNSGALATPFKTIEKALSITPRGGFCCVLLKSDYTLTGDITVDGVHLSIVSDSSIKRALTFERQLLTAFTPALRAVRQFKLSSGSLNLSGLTINFPFIDGDWGNYAPANSHIVGGNGSYQWRPIDVTVFNCNVNIPASPFCSFIQSAVLADLHWYGNTLTGAVTSVNGRLLADQTNTAGVDTTTLPYLRTTLSTI